MEQNKILTQEKKEPLFGSRNWRWLVKELVHIYSGKSSFFSKKRIESSIAFIIGQIGMIWFLSVNIDGLSVSDIAVWSGIEFAISGYILNQIQKEKKDDSQNTSEGDEI
jgi:hypothetical protein